MGGFATCSDCELPVDEERRLLFSSSNWFILLLALPPLSLLPTLPLLLLRLSEAGGWLFSLSISAQV